MIETYRVRKGFNFDRNGQNLSSGAILELDEKELKLYAHLVEKVVKAKTTAKAEPNTVKPKEVI
jgi:hypothetical protein